MTGIDGLLTVCSALLIARAIDIKRKKIYMGKRMLKEKKNDRSVSLPDKRNEDI